MGWSSSKTSSGGGGGGSVESVTGLNTDNTDPTNPVVKISTSTGLSGAGTPASPLTNSAILNINDTDNFIPVKSNNTTFVDSFLVSDTINETLKTNFGLLSDGGFLIDIGNDFYFLNDNGGNLSVDWSNRILVSRNLSTGLAYDCTFNKTESEFYQNNFLVSTSVQDDVLNNAVASGEIWYSGHTIQGVIDVGVTEIGSLVALQVGTWTLANFSSTSTNAEFMMGIFVGGQNVLLDGHIVAVQNGVSTSFPQIQNINPLLVGFPIYASGGSPAFDVAPPSGTGDYIRTMGHCYRTEDDYYLFLFRPSNDWTFVP
jgi:hypothetical protein